MFTTAVKYPGIVIRSLAAKSFISAFQVIKSKNTFCVTLPAPRPTDQLLEYSYL